MEEIGQVRVALVAGATLALSVLACAVTWPFAIDDALISVRYARHLASGAGYVWNVGAAPTDGVTPLPWAFVLAPLAHTSALAVLSRAKLMGVCVWAAASLVWGRAVARAQATWGAKLGAVALLALNLPVAAHAVSGMETALAMALVTTGSTLYARPRVAACSSGSRRPSGPNSSSGP